MKEQHPWIGKTIFGGAGFIPLRRSYDRLSAPGIALLGDAACHVFSANGCGVGNGLIAARILADSVKGHDDPGSREATWAYQAAYQHERGGIHAASDVFRRLSQTLMEEDVEALLETVIITADKIQATLAHKMPAFNSDGIL